MAKRDLKNFVKSRPAYFWWTLANLLAAAFAVASWTVCLFIFNFPERAKNYELLRKLKRLEPVFSYTPLNAPKGDGAGPQALLTKFYSFDDTQLAAHNRQFKRNYITNFKESEAVTYVEGTYKITQVRELTGNDFFHPGFALGARAMVLSDETSEPNAYPVVLELLLPYDRKLEAPPFKTGDPLVLKKIDHRALVLHAAKVGSAGEPTVGLTAVPIAFRNMKDTDGKRLPLDSPDPLNVAARFPVLKRNRTE